MPTNIATVPDDATPAAVPAGLPIALPVINMFAPTVPTAMASVYGATAPDAVNAVAVPGA